MKRRAKMVSIRLSEDEYRRIKEMTEAQGARSVSDVARSAMHLMLANYEAGTEATMEARMQEMDGRLNELGDEIQRLSRLVAADGKG